MQEPIAIDSYRGGAPGFSEVSFGESGWKMPEQKIAPIISSAFAKGRHRMHTGRIKVTVRQFRIGVALAPEVAPNISAVFLQKSLSFILGMALKKNEQTFSLFDEHVDAAVFRTRENTVAASC